MPFWAIYHTDSIFKDAASKKALARDITQLHVEKIGLPAFYVVISFIPLPKDGLLVGGEEKDKPFVRITIDQIAHKMEVTAENYSYWTGEIDKVLAPHIADKNYDWEYHIDETELRLWKVNGMYAPPFGSEEMEKWKKFNKAFPRETAEDMQL